MLLFQRRPRHSGTPRPGEGPAGDGQKREGTMSRYAFSLGFIGLLVVASSPDASAHTKGLTLSRFGLIDVSLRPNVAYVNLCDLSRVDLDTLRHRHPNGLILTG